MPRQHPGKRLTEDDLWRRGRFVGECLEWQGWRDQDGYGRLQWQGTPTSAHRLSYELAVGPIPAGLHVCHRCDNPPCFEPTHLFLGTNADNTADRDAKGRTSRGEQRPAAKLDAEKVREIRALWADGVTQVALGRRFGVRQTTVSRIVLRQAWGHVQ